MTGACVDEDAQLDVRRDNRRFCEHSKTIAQFSDGHLGGVARHLLHTDEFASEEWGGVQNTAASVGFILPVDLIVDPLLQAHVVGWCPVLIYTTIT